MTVLLGSGYPGFSCFPLPAIVSACRAATGQRISAPNLVRSLQAKRAARKVTRLELCGKLRRFSIAKRPAAAGRPDGLGRAVLDVVHATAASCRVVGIRRVGISFDLSHFRTGFAQKALASGRPVVLGSSAARRNQARNENGSTAVADDMPPNRGKDCRGLPKSMCHSCGLP